MSLALFDWFGLVLLIGCAVWCVPGGIVRPGLALAGMLSGGIVLTPLVVAVVIVLAGQLVSSEGLRNIQPVIFLIFMGAGGVAGWWLGKPLATVINCVPGLNLLNLGAGLVTGSSLGLLILVFVFNLLLLLLPTELATEWLAPSWLIGNLVVPLEKMAWWWTVD